MRIETEIRDKAKQHRLKALRVKYFEIYMDMVSMQATGDAAGAEVAQNRLDNIQKAYETVEAIPTEEG